MKRKINSTTSTLTPYVSPELLRAPTGGSSKEPELGHGGGGFREGRGGAIKPGNVVSRTPQCWQSFKQMEPCLAGRNMRQEASYLSYLSTYQEFLLLSFVFTHFYFLFHSFLSLKIISSTLEKKIPYSWYSKSRTILHSLYLCSYCCLANLLITSLIFNFVGTQGMKDTI